MGDVGTGAATAASAAPAIEPGEEPPTAAGATATDTHVTETAGTTAPAGPYFPSDLSVTDEATSLVSLSSFGSNLD